MTRRITGLLASGALLMSGGAGVAHHSFSMFNMELPTELEGTVQEFRFSNPHSYLLLKVKGPDGHVVTWTLEGASPASLGRDGWSGQTLRPGDQIRLTIWPLQGGGHGGVWYPKWTHFRDGRAIVSSH